MKSRKEEIIDAAARLFREKGYRATSMKDIAADVGMEAASLYNHIKSKHEILEYLLMSIADFFTGKMDEISESSLTSIQKLEKLISLHVEQTIQKTDAIAIITSEWVHLEGPAYGNYTGLRKLYESKFKNIIEQCIQEGYMAPVNSEVALFSILSTLRWLYSWYAKNKISAIELEKEMRHCLLNGLRVR